jgi:hypothetical protein
MLSVTRKSILLNIDLLIVIMLNVLYILYPGAYVKKHLQP